MKSRIFNTISLPVGVDIALLIMRLVVGYAFILHGWGKIQHPMTWMGPDAVYPGAIQALAAISEFAGGILLILGLLTRIAAFGIICTMVVAIYTHAIVMHDPFVNPKGGSFELASVYLAIALLLITIGAGRYSVDRLLSGRTN